MTDVAFDPLRFHERAVRTPSHDDVEEMRTLLVETLRASGADVRVDDAGNTVATRAADAAEGPHLVFNTHVDTVPPHVPYVERSTVPDADYDPPDVDADRDADCPAESADLDPEAVVCGRGACDAKGPLAAMVDAFFAADLDAGRLTLAITPDEERRSRGAAALDLDADAYVVGEPTGLDVCTAAKGRFEGTVRIEGEAAHAADPASGRSAIRAAAPIIQAMESYDEERGPGEHDSLGRPTLSATTIAGGEATNQIPAECTITFDRRSVPPETSEGFRSGLTEHCRRWLPDGMGLSVALTDRETPFLEAFSTDPAARVVETIRAAGGGATRPFSAATEASYFAGDAPTVVFGPGVLTDEVGAVAHAKREYVRRRDVLSAAATLRETAARFCR